MADTLVPTLDEQGPTHVFEGDLQAWLDENQDMRPEGSGPNFEWTIGDEAAAVGNLERAQELAKNDESGEMQARLDEFPMDVLADMLGDDGYDFSPEGERARKLEKMEEREEILADMGPFESVMPEATDEERAFNLEQIKDTMQQIEDTEEAPTPETSSRQYPNELSRTVTRPDGFVEFDEEVFPDPERDRVGGNFRAFREGVARRALEKEEAKRKGKQDPASTLGPSMTE